MRKVFAAVLLAAIAVGVLAWSQRPTGPLYVSGFIEADDIRVGSRVGGRVLEVAVAEGQHVARGAPLLTLEPFDLQERLAEARATLAARQARHEQLGAGYRAEEIEQARARRAQAQAVLAKAEAGPRPLEIRILEDKVEFARAELVKAESDYARVKGLFDGGKAAPDEMTAATGKLDSAKARFAEASDSLALAKEGTRAEELAQARAALAEAEQAVALLEKGYRPEDVAEASANVAAAQAAVEMVKRQLDELRVVAPCACDVEAVDLQPGDLIAPNAPVIALVDPSRLWVRAYVPENRLSLTLEQKVTVRVDAFPGRRFAGHVGFISRQAEFTPSNIQTPEERSKQVFRIKVLLDEGHDVLRPGLSADVFLEPQP
jgi:HlyD family secretion protein